VTGRGARAAVFIRLKFDLVFPVSVRDDLTEVSGTLAGVHGVTRPAGPASARLTDVHVVEIQVTVPELSDSPAVLGGNQLTSVAGETQLIVVRIEGSVE
jgi:hypothetical protein